MYVSHTLRDTAHIQDRSRQAKKRKNKTNQNSICKIATELQSKNKYLCTTDELCFNHIIFSNFRNGNNAMQRWAYL